MSVPFLRGNRTTVSTGGVQKTVAVLPFDNVSGDAGTDYLRLALADEVATALSWTPSLAVRPVAASRRFVGGIRPQEAGQQLRVDEIVTGHFSTHQSELRVTVEAVDVDDNRLLWRDSIAARTDESLALHDRLTSLIRRGLLPALGAESPAQEPRIRRDPPYGPSLPHPIPATRRRENASAVDAGRYAFGRFIVGALHDRNLSRHRRAWWMLSNMLWGGSFHRHIMTIGGRTATAARTVQPDSEFAFAAMPATDIAETQTIRARA